jgi:hypothetical protein
MLDVEQVGDELIRNVAGEKAQAEDLRSENSNWIHHPSSGVGRLGRARRAVEVEAESTQGKRGDLGLKISLGVGIAAPIALSPKLGLVSTSFSEASRRTTHAPRRFPQDMWED